MAEKILFGFACGLLAVGFTAVIAFIAVTFFAGIRGLFR